MSAIEGPDFAFARGGSTRPVSYATDIGVDHWFSAFSRWIIGGLPEFLMAHREFHKSLIKHSLT